MRVFPVASVVLLSLSAFPHVAKAITVSELPATIQSCVTAGGCVVSSLDSYDSGTASAYAMYDLYTGQQDWLMRYGLTSPSGQTDIEGALTSAYSGYLWMQVASFYTAADTEHAVTLFLDKVSPIPSQLFDQSGDLSLFLTTDDLLAGGAFRTQSDPGYGDYDAGSLSGEIPLICLAEGCQINAQLNLVQLNYQSSGSSIVMTGFDGSDKRGLVYSQSSFYYNGDPANGVAQSFYITAVPEPSAAWLFGFGLVGVSAMARRRRARSQ